MAFNRTMLRNRNWWIELVGVLLQGIGFLVIHTGILRLVLVVVGMGFFLFGGKKVYDNLEMKAKGYDLFPKNPTLRTP